MLDFNFVFRIVFVSAALLLGLAGCGSDGDAATRMSSVSAYKPDLRGADPRLARIYAQSSRLLGGGRPAFERRLRQLRGLPVVVNKWGSWCGPCRNEFPLFQQAAKKLGGKVAFLGVNVNDSRGSARQFLRERPVPYPSYVDDHLAISVLLPPVGGAPTTGFYDTSGKKVHVKAGEYKSTAQLTADIRRYALASEGMD